MNICLLMLVSLASAISASPSSPFSGVDPNSPLPPSPLGISYRCATAQPDPGRQMPIPLDCLNILTYVLATTPNRDRPTKWSRTPGYGYTMLPYRRGSGTCQLVVRLAASAPIGTVEIATFNQVVGAAMRIIEVCLLGARPGVDRSGGVAVAGLGGHLDIVVWGARDVGGDEGVLSNGTAALNGSAGWVDQASQS